MKKKMTFTSTGDALIMKRLPQGYEGYEQLVQYINRAETKITNLETTLSKGDCYASSFSGGTWLTVDPSVLDDFKDMGFNLYSWANNHTLDFSYGGVESTKKALDDAGVAHAGAGMNLYEASRPAMLDLPSGRVALISICSTFDPSARAGRQSESMPGRPGLNPLRYTQTYTVSPSHMKALKEMADATQINAREESAVKMGFLKPAPEGCFKFNGTLFKEGKEGEPESRFSTVNKEDLERTTRTIQDALLTCDYVVVMVHSHEVKAASDEEADYFFEQFARACIDAGASIIFGGGTHQLKGIEVYKGKPIFYSLGNFIFQNEYVKLLPPDYMEKHGFPLTYTASEGIAARTAAATGVAMHDKVDNFRSVIPFVEMDGDECVKVELLPIDLGMDKPMHFKNIPYPANEKISKEIYDYLMRTSAQYGTKMELKDGLIHVNLK